MAKWDDDSSVGMPGRSRLPGVPHAVGVAAPRTQALQSPDNAKTLRPGQLLTIEQLSEWLQVPKQTVYKWRSCGHGPRGYRIGKHVRFEVKEIERWLLAQQES